MSSVRVENATKDCQLAILSTDPRVTGRGHRALRLEDGRLEP